MENKKPTAEIVRQTLDLLIENAESIYDLTTIKFTIQDYMTEGYYIKEQIQKYNEKINKFYAQRN